MKKIFLLAILVILLTGCTSIKKETIENITYNTTHSKVSTTNVNRNGYRYYLPHGISVIDSTNYNEILTDQKYKYYLYVDIVSYNKKIDFNYNLNKQAKYSEKLENNGKFGFIEINNYKNDQYLIEIMYNYAKIEVVAYEKDLNECVTYAMVVLTSVTYNEDVIEKYLASSTLDTVEESFDIFEIIGSDNYLEFKDDIGTGESTNDPDYIN